MKTAKPTELLGLILSLGGEVVRQRGSHVFVRVGDCSTVVAMHKGQDVPNGTLKSIERDLAPCLGSRWLRDA